MTNYRPPHAVAAWTDDDPTPHALRGRALAEYVERVTAADDDDAEPSRLTPGDWDRIDARTDETIARWAGQHHTERYTMDTTGADVLARLAHASIGCNAYDLRDAELSAIADRIAERYAGRTFRRHAADWRRIVEV